MKLRAAKLAIALVSVAAVVLGLASYWQDAELAVQAVHAELAGAAELKTLVVVRWVAGIKNGARSLAGMPVLSEEVRHWMAEPRSPRTRRDLERWLELVRAFGGCSDASVLDAEGRLLMASPARERDSRPIVSGLGEGPAIVPAERPLGEGDDHRVAFCFELARSSGESRENGSRKVAGGQPNLGAGVLQPRTPRPRLRLELARSSGESRENGSRKVAGGQPNLEAGAASPRPPALACGSSWPAAAGNRNRTPRRWVPCCWKPIPTPFCCPCWRPRPARIGPPRRSWYIARARTRWCCILWLPGPAGFS